MKNYLNCKKIDTAIGRAKKILINRAKANGIYEDFGQKEIREIEDRFIDICDHTEKMNNNRMKLFSFECWCMGYSM